MGKKGVRIMKWKCKCGNITVSDGRPTSCKFCDNLEPHKFYGAKVIKNEFYGNKVIKN